jgi:hypothetical protein
VHVVSAGVMRVALLLGAFATAGGTCTSVDTHLNFYAACQSPNAASGSYGGCSGTYNKPTTNSLDGQGPGSNGTDIRYTNIGAVSTQAIDLLVSVKVGGSYVVGGGTADCSNGCNGMFGQVNVRVGSGLNELLFQFVQTGTTTAQEVASFYFSIFDLDHGAPRSPASHRPAPRAAHPPTPRPRGRREQRHRRHVRDGAARRARHTTPAPPRSRCSSCVGPRR